MGSLDLQSAASLTLTLLGNVFVGGLFATIRVIQGARIVFPPLVASYDTHGRHGEAAFLIRNHTGCTDDNTCITLRSHIEDKVNCTGCGCLGYVRDSHDMVLRFNNAPTENYTEDVGTKTTFRVLNSQVVTKPEFKFLEDPLFRGVSILVWDPANYSSTLEDWYHHPDYNLFPVYKRLLEQRKRSDVHLLYPQILWDLWSVLQDTSPYRLRRNPPSSGFIGLWFSLHRCMRVRVFEYVPSARATRRCHYHAPRDDAACTLGAWHPLAHEKALAERMRTNTDVDVFQRGFVDIPAFNTIACH